MKRPRSFPILRLDKQQQESGFKRPDFFDRAAPSDAYRFRPFPGSGQRPSLHQSHAPFIPAHSRQGQRPGDILKIPTMPAVERLAKDKQIADTLRTSPTTATVRRLASLHGVPMRSIAKSFSKRTGEGLKNARLRESRGAPPIPIITAALS